MRIFINILDVLLAITILSFNLSTQAQEFLPAEPYGGARQMKEFFKEEMVYPPEALKNQKEGIVDIIVSIDNTGEVTKYEVHNSVSDQIDAEALRLVKMILWKPAFYMGDDINDQQTVSIKFSIRKYKQYCKERGYEAISYPFMPVDNSNRVYDFDQLDTIPVLVFNDQKMTLTKFINQHIRYPDAALQYNITGTEKINFVVEPSGRISNIYPENYLGGGCCEETIRLATLLKWYPGIKNNKAVRVMMSISITFNLSNDSDVRFVPTQLNNSMQ